MTSENSKTSEPCRLLRYLPHKINLKRSDKYVGSSHLSMYYAWKNIKRHTKTTNIKYQLQQGMKNLNCLTDHIIYEVFKITLNVS